MTTRFDTDHSSVQSPSGAPAKKFNILGASMVVLGAAIIGLPAVAQDAADAESTARRLGTVTVTARKVEENLQEVPVAVTAFTGAELAEKGVVQVNDLVVRSLSQRPIRILTVCQVHSKHRSGTSAHKPTKVFSTCL